MEAQSLVSHQHSWWFSCFSLREKLARSHNKKIEDDILYHLQSIPLIKYYFRLVSSCVTTGIMISVTNSSKF